MARSSAENLVLSTAEMLAAQVQVSHTVMVRIAAICLKCVVDLGIYPTSSPIKTYVISHSELLKKLPNIPPSKSPLLHRIMRLLARMGYFKIIENKSSTGDEENHDELVLYSLTPLSRVLPKTEPFSLSSYVLGSNNPYSTS
ncbi:uncharacterized protein A4U43_C09F5920 [Asparagus officinalis]|uniref:Uncharacterized protein n=1 Tax=Asparagus officinalis TaxID=4686 RepID=A0A5P1E8W5_ASPOF|nr:uncharacterized protein A4U43_C09F5920 [Asparagus officinalis]